MSYVTKSWVKTQFDNFASRISAVFAKKEEVEDLKKSVSDGKTLVADAITEKGIDTAADATFATMAENIWQIGTGGDINLQESVTVKSTLSQQTILPDEGYGGISEVVVEPMNLEIISNPLIFIEDAFEMPFTPQKSYILSSSADYDGIKYVTEHKVFLQNKTVESTEEEQAVLPDKGYDALSKVVVKGVSSSNITTCDYLGSTTGLNIIPEGYKAYIFFWITTGNDTSTILTYGNSNSPGYLYHRTGRGGSGNVKAVYSISVYDGSIGGSAPIRSGVSFIGLK